MHIFFRVLHGLQVLQLILHFLAKNEFANWQVHLITNDLELPKKLRLKPRRRTPVFNGDIECRLFGFEMVSDSYRDKS